MDITIREPVYIVCDGQEYVVRPGTTGVEKDRVSFFYDCTRTVAVGFSRDYCLDNPKAFSVSKTILDKEVSLKDVMDAISKSDLPKSEIQKLYSIIKTL